MDSANPYAAPSVALDDVPAGGYSAVAEIVVRSLFWMRLLVRLSTVGLGLFALGLLGGAVYGGPSAFGLAVLGLILLGMLSALVLPFIFANGI